MGFPLRYQVQEANRIGDHICYISDLTKLGSHFPDWHMEYDIRKSIEDILKYQYDASKCGSMSSL